MNTIEVKSFEKPDETRPFQGNGMADIVMLGGKPVARGTFEPGWKWSKNVKPLAGTELCEVQHLIYLLQGRMVVHMKDGSEQELTPGEVAFVLPGHDAEVIGNEACIALDFGEIATYAKPS
ncbi:hypothetical protein HDA40_005257 [Hamadaea flava]|uniref:Cupin domain-containing protein n=1 Tax=Hamadaea flava TaxID=1742688 RepID=A0ABV8LZR8_9ACTN|nr:cupin domain-containing protein [Hamadaea flava]MCP2326750.1 hypothetical protein [Hamadaea flava]